jgi:putative hydrolase of the HAD superfamily
MRINNIKHIFFDLDHTLWDFDKNSALTFEKIFKLNNILIPLKEFLKYYEPINLAYWKLYREEKVDKETLRYKRLKDTFNAVGFEVSDKAINKLSVDYIAYLSSFNHLFIDTLEILDYLHTKYNLHIITNGFQEVQHKKLDKSNISHYFKTVTNSEMVGVKKPNPKIFEFALDKATAKVTESIMIGDSYEADVLGALNYGMEAIWYNNHKNNELVTKQVSSLLELKSFL